MLQPTPIPTEFPVDTTTQPLPTPVLSGAGTVTLKATHDTFVDSTSPNTNYGDKTWFKVDGSPTRLWSLISFDTTSIMKNAAKIDRHSDISTDNEPRNMQSIKVESAKLRLYTIDEGGGALFYALPNASPDISDLTWNNMWYYVDRSDEFRVGAFGWHDANKWYEIDVTDAVNLSSNGDVVIMIKSWHTNGVEFASRERDSGSYSPELVMSFAFDLKSDNGDFVLVSLYLHCCVY